MEDLIIGSHVSFNKNSELLGSVEEALSYNANTFMFYTGAPQNTTRLPLHDNFTKEALDLMKNNNIDINNVVVHAPYIINLANKNNLDFSKKVSEDISIIIPAGKWHNLINIGNEPIKLFSIYAPPQHQKETIQVTKTDAGK